MSSPLPTSRLGAVADLASRLDFAGFPQAEFRFQLGSPLRRRSLCTEATAPDRDAEVVLCDGGSP